MSCNALTCLKNYLQMVWNEKRISKFHKKFIKNYDEDSDVRKILEVEVEYPKRFYNFHNNLEFLPERMKIKRFHKLVCKP